MSLVTKPHSEPTPLMKVTDPPRVVTSVYVAREAPDGSWGGAEGATCGRCSKPLSVVEVAVEV